MPFFLSIFYFGSRLMYKSVTGNRQSGRYSWRIALGWPSFTLTLTLPNLQTNLPRSLHYFAIMFFRLDVKQRYSVLSWNLSIVIILLERIWGVSFSSEKKWNNIPIRRKTNKFLWARLISNIRFHFRNETCVCRKQSNNFIDILSLFIYSI